ncbi:HD domain-containing protein [Bacteroidales bacterium OttesenSCG-928-B11]|nr:HD domain-containing protein [Bacteroidales bacterium OttesenSCG-928-B11]
MKIENVLKEMRRIFETVPYGITHTMRVLNNAELISETELLTSDMIEIIKLSSILHDIGAIEAERKHGNMSGKFQEIEGPPIAFEILNKYGFDKEIIERVCFIVGNHHSPEKINGLDFQILWESDLLENMQMKEEIINNTDMLKDFISLNFKTDKGKELAHSMYLTKIETN